MRVLFIYTNINGYHSDCYAFGLASIVSVTRHAGHEARVVVVRKKEEYKKVNEIIYEFQPQVVGFSSVSSQFIFVKEICQVIKKINPSIITVCGGVHPTIQPSCILQTEDLDCIFIGESEKSFEEFLENIIQGRDYHDTDNLAYGQAGRLIRNPLKPLLEDLDSLPKPDREAYPFEDTILASGYAPFFFSRGCPFLCSYCSNHAIAYLYGMSHNTPRYRDPELCIQEIEETVKKFPRIKNIYIGDDIFGIDKKWRKEFCEKYRERIRIRYFCALRVNVIDEEFLRLLKESGCYRILIGVESGNDYVRNRIMNRNMTNKQIETAFALVSRFKIQTVALNIIGVPGETEEMMEDTISLNRKIRPTLSGVNIFYPYKGTKLGDFCFANHLVDENLYENFSNERRQSVLIYQSDIKDKLAHYQENWDALIYPYDIRRRALRMIKASFLWHSLSLLKSGLKTFNKK